MRIKSIAINDLRRIGLYYVNKLLRRNANSPQNAVMTTTKPVKKRTRKSGSIAARITAWRVKAGLTQGEAAKAFSVSKRCYQTWESGERAPRQISEDMIEQVLKRA